MSILVTGATGYIGSHTIVELLNKGYDVVGIDDFSNSSPDVLGLIEKISNQKITFYEGDISDEKLLAKVFSRHKIKAVIHFAGKKAVGESVECPLLYYQVNVSGFITLLKAMENNSVNNIIISSSATVYGDENAPPFDETFTTNPTNPYGESKLMMEKILSDACKSNKMLTGMSLRYFNPVGAHDSGLIGENPNGIPNNLVPYIMDVAVGNRDILTVFGDDYPTPDGTGVRDYIHVVDLAIGHVSALEYCQKNYGFEAVNLGTGIGYSVMDVIKTFELVNDVPIKYSVGDRRLGDVAFSFANSDKAKKLFGWTAKKGLEDMCRDTWRYMMREVK